ncbi:hypothetical protein EJ07DRAFT_158687 [Lizonia empirigonia]|nr:hypothetical protein EJ07DRAFT_158687 [Lizonia empirigonia]
MADPKSNPFSFTRRTTIILVSVLPAVVLFALLMGIWHCVRKYNIARRIEAESKDIENTLHRPARLAIDQQLPERSRSTAHQVPKPRIPNLPNLPNLKIETHVSDGNQIRPAPVVGGEPHQHHFEDRLLGARTPGIAPVRQYGGRDAKQVYDHEMKRTAYLG